MIKEKFQILSAKWDYLSLQPDGLWISNDYITGYISTRRIYRFHGSLSQMVEVLLPKYHSVKAAVKF